ncbi:MAG: alpha/beta hydrolase, partial [Chloroflexi bacterium]|nr:alpha/beta hydrolase [Chloroflexota bacterium]
MQTPETRYAKSGDVNIAYQVVGDGPLDLVLVPGFASHLEVAWEEPSLARLLSRLASFSRLITFDKRGTGLSDRVSLNELPTLEQRMDDVRAVMDALGSDRAALFGISEGGPMSVLFAATYPERTSALVLYGAMAGSSAPELRPTAEQVEAIIAPLRQTHGQGISVGRYAPSLAGDEQFRRWLGRLERLGASPGAFVALARMNMEIDV